MTKDGRFKFDVDLDSLDFEEDILIDESALDVEWLNQSDLFFKYSAALAEADRIAKRAHENLKTIRSELRLEAAEGGEDLIGTKPTADNVDAWVRIQDTYKKAKEDFHKREYEADILRGAVFAMRQRKDALENLVRLHGQSYFAGPTEPRNLSDESLIRQSQRKRAKEISRPQKSSRTK